MKSDYLKIITNAFPQELTSDVSEIFKIIPLETKFKFDLISSVSYEVNVGDNGLNIQGIGMTKAARIAYYALTSILNSAAQYYDSKNATLQAAITLYGQCSQEHISVAKAWNAVNVSAGNPCPTASVDDLVDQNDIIIYPNPTSSTLNFEISKSLDDDVKIYDLNGKIVKILEIKSTYYSTNISELERGTYFVHFTINGQTLVKRIILQ